MNYRKWSLEADIKLKLGGWVLCNYLTQAQADQLMLMVKEYFAGHWRDDDSPQAERTFGVRRAA